jgi:DNA mismatch repair ATPase MutS
MLLNISQMILNSLKTQDISEKIQDIERAFIKGNFKSANARDLVAIKISIVHLPKIKKSLSSSRNAYLNHQSREISPDFRDEGNIKEHCYTPPISLRDRDHQRRIQY